MNGRRLYARLRRVGPMGGHLGEISRLRLLKDIFLREHDDARSGLVGLSHEQRSSPDTRRCLTSKVVNDKYRPTQRSLVPAMAIPKRATKLFLGAWSIQEAKEYRR